jgi:hypothetical protein
LGKTLSANTIFARSTSRAGVLRPRDQANSVLLSSAVNSIVGATRTDFILLERMKPRKPE